jgi:hypothetical protein
MCSKCVRIHTYTHTHTNACTHARRMSFTKALNEEWPWWMIHASIITTKMNDEWLNHHNNDEWFMLQSPQPWWMIHDSIITIMIQSWQQWSSVDAVLHLPLTTSTMYTHIYPTKLSHAGQGRRQRVCRCSSRSGAHGMPAGPVAAQHRHKLNPKLNPWLWDLLLRNTGTN